MYEVKYYLISIKTFISEIKLVLSYLQIKYPNVFLITNLYSYSSILMIKI